MLRFDAPTWVLIFAMITFVVTGVLCLMNWQRRRGWKVALLESLRFLTVLLILFTLCKPEIENKLPQKEDKQIDIVLLVDRSDSMTTEDVDIGEQVEPISRKSLLNARLGVLGVLAQQLGNSERVIRVFEPSPASAIGLKVGDEITRISIPEKLPDPGIDQRMGTTAGTPPLTEFLAEKADYLEGREGTLTVRREGEPDSIEIKVVFGDLAGVLEAALRDRDIEASVYLEEFAMPDANASAPELQGTDISSAIIAQTENYENLVALLLLSDGDSNQGSPPTAAAARALRDKGVAAHTVINMGSRFYTPDVELEMGDIQSKGVVDDRIAIPFTVKNYLDIELTTNINLWLTNKFTGRSLRYDAQSITVPRIDDRGRGGEGSGRFIWEAPREGNYTMLVDLPVSGAETSVTNNHHQFSIEIKPETNKVLVIDSRPRWEYRYLRNALMRDKKVDVRVLLLHPGMRRGDGSGYIQHFPPLERTPEQKNVKAPFTLSDFDVIFLGDVGLGPNEVTPENADALRKMVEHQSAGLVFMPGPLGRQLSFYTYKKHKSQQGDSLKTISRENGVAMRTLGYANPTVNWDALQDGTSINIPHPLADLIPIAYDTTMPVGNWTGMSGNTGMDIPEARFNMMPEGRESPLLLLSKEGEATSNDELWRSVLPGFYWHASVLRDTPGSRVLAVHDSKRNRYGYLPLIVTQPAGNGQTLFMGTDSAWRWRKFVGADYHYRYWSQVVRWMGHRRKQATGIGMFLVVDKERPAMGDTLTVEAIISDWADMGENEKVEASILLPNNATQPLDFEPVPGGLGNYRAVFRLEQSGVHTIKAATTRAKREVTKKFDVERRTTEVVGRTIDAPLLTTLALDTRGSAMNVDNLSPMLDRIFDKIHRKPEVDIYPLWADPWWGGLILLLLALYWTMRKVLGLI